MTDVIPIGNPARAREGATPKVDLRSLETLWFQVGGTVCNLACSHCFVSSSPTNRTHDFVTLERVRETLEAHCGTTK